MCVCEESFAECGAWAFFPNGKLENFFEFPFLLRAFDAGLVLTSSIVGYHLSRERETSVGRS